MPGVNVQTAATFMAAVGDIRRFASPRKLVGYLGLDPRVRQSGNGRARHGRISKAGASAARHMLGEAAWTVTLTPGPLRAFFERIRARRGPQIAATATARKLAVLFWHLLTPRAGLRLRAPRDDRATRSAGSSCRRRPAAERPPRHRGRQIQAVFDAERELSRQAETAYRRTSPTGKPPARRKRVRARHRGAHLKGPRRAKPRGRPRKPQGLLFATSVTRTHRKFPQGAPRVHVHLTFIRR